MTQADTHEETATYRAIDPRTGEPTGPAFPEATAQQVRVRAAAAMSAFRDTSEWPGERRAALLERAADRLEQSGDELVLTADLETGLGADRLHTEVTRTTNQLRAFADLVREGSYVEAILSPAPADGSRPDVRRMLLPIGPVAVFGASNFPIAFSVPGGDTASALAVGCPVVAKAHPSHPATSDLCGRAIADAVADVDGPPGMFSLLHGTGPEVGQALVTDPDITAVGFTGSLRGGRALFDVAAQRPDPIPVYAEMGSLNPFAVTPGALRARAAEIAAGFVQSFTQGTGQYCTKPGLVLLPDSPDAETFVTAIRQAVQSAPATVMLNPAIHTSFSRDLEHLVNTPGVTVLAEAPSPGGQGLSAAPTVLVTDVETLAANPMLLDEHFGPVTIIVRCPDLDAAAKAVASVPGGLTGTIHVADDEADAPEIAALAKVLRDRAGRLIINGYPTGVVVNHAQHHGGPYPATTSAGHTSVGMTAVRRFLRPFAYQNAPDALLPPALQDDNPLGILRWVDGEPTRAGLTR